MTHLVLAGGGHAHVLVLEHLMKQPVTGLQVTLISNCAQQYYSGMLPGWMNGIYSTHQCQIDLAQLCYKAGARFVLGHVTHIDTKAQRVCLQDQLGVEYGLVSLALGSRTKANLISTNSVCSVKPFDQFAHRWQQWRRLQSTFTTTQLTIIGSGAAGVELALAARQVMLDDTVNRKIILYTGPKGVLPQFHHKVQKLALQALAKAKGEVVEQYAAPAQYEAQYKTDASRFTIFANGAQPSVVLNGPALDSDLALDDKGFVLVDEYQRSISHLNVFAAGDICSRPNTPLQRSGVHAIRAGAVLAHNLVSQHLNRESEHNSALRAFVPRRHNLYILSCSDGSAIASYAISWGTATWHFAIKANRIWYLKNWIDTRFIRRFNG